jgi:hypothetical protein
MAFLVRKFMRAPYFWAVASGSARRRRKGAPLTTPRIIEEKR